ncbi:MAG: hypothetical protein IAF94_26980 [Pirellulaceae bacterium]|nr:hypothetical protein [Pirellulaceae bacterium]
MPITTHNISDKDIADVPMTGPFDGGKRAPSKTYVTGDGKQTHLLAGRTE